MTLQSGLPQTQSSATAKMYKDTFAIRGAGNDAGWIRFFETSNNGSLEIATGNDGSEPICVRQYNASSAMVRQAILLDASGNTSFPETLTANIMSPKRLKIPTTAPASPTTGDIWLE